MSATMNRLLVLDDSAQCRQQYMLGARTHDYQVLLTGDIEEFKKAYFRDRPTVLALNVMIGGEACGDAVDFLARCRCIVPLVLTNRYSAPAAEDWRARMRGTGLRLAATARMDDDLSAFEAVLLALRSPDADPRRASVSNAASISRD